MKPIEELGINLTPWVKYGDIVEDAEGNVIYKAYDDSDYQNANIIAAAPKLYEALSEVWEEYMKNDLQCSIERLDALMFKVEDALNEAGGKEDDND